MISFSGEAIKFLVFSTNADYLPWIGQTAWSICEQFLQR